MASGDVLLEDFEVGAPAVVKPGKQCMQLVFLRRQELKALIETRRSLQHKIRSCSWMRGLEGAVVLVKFGTRSKYSDSNFYLTCIIETREKGTPTGKEDQILVWDPRGSRRW
eukprot:CAMPEP_0177624722 /NCGR_PEP_ID=MMETSP0419_2-20121207/29659_1 /TAXON_ID=582737 /ORGANISM="Tetraselmis sp., Strain GSL018" /LENGTH=111 /DNA_ID=CAMNT_0019125503 /DNA_START=248 /DNA_END=580 /DNA_ORIENTATION=+